VAAEDTMTLPLVDDRRPKDTRGNETLAQQVHRELAAALMRGEFLPGAVLTLRGLAERLGTSVMPVREAVSRLAATQALELHPNRSIVVPNLSRRDIDALWRMRFLVDVEAAAAAAECAERARIDALSNLAIAMWRTLETGDAAGMRETSGQWAMLIAEASGSPLLIDYVTNLRLRCAPHIGQAFTAGLDPEDSLFGFILRVQDQTVEAMRGRGTERIRNLRLADMRSFQLWVYRRLGWTSPA
jgi:DNA-binding GntR family transcriptional regulator